MYYFGIAPLPGGQVHAYPKNDIASYVDIFDAAVALSSRCVEEKSSPQAGWSVTGKIRSFIKKKLSITPSAFRIGILEPN